MNKIKNYDGARYKKFVESLKPQFKKPVQTQSEAPVLKTDGGEEITPATGALEYTFKWPSENFELSGYAETEYTKQQKDLRRLEKMDKKLVQVDKYKTADGQEMVLSVPQRLAHLFDSENK